MKIVNIIFTGIIIASIIWHTVKKIKALMISLKKLNVLCINKNAFNDVRNFIAIEDNLKQKNDALKKQTRQAIIKEIWVFIITLIILWAAGLFNVIFEVIKWN